MTDLNPGSLILQQVQDGIKLAFGKLNTTTGCHPDDTAQPI